MKCVLLRCSVGEPHHVRVTGDPCHPRRAMETFPLQPALPRPGHLCSTSPPQMG